MNDTEITGFEDTTLPAMGKVHTFNGAALQPFSTCRDDLYSRLTFDTLTEREAAGLFVFICTQPPERCVMVRGDKAEARFRADEAEWRDSIGWQTNPKLRDEAMAIRKEVMEDIERAQSVSPEAAKSSGPTPGNA